MNTSKLPFAIDAAPTASESIDAPHTDSGKSMLVVLPLAPWPARDNGVSIRYYPIIEHLATRHSIDVYVHGELRSAVPRDPILDSLHRVIIEHANRRSPRAGDRLLTLVEAFSPFGQPYHYAKYHADALYERLRKFVAGRKYDTVLWVTCEYRRVLNRLRPELSGARIVYDSVDSPYLHYSRHLKSHDVHSAWRAYDLWKTRRWERALLSGVDSSAYVSLPDASACANSSLRAQVIPNGIYTANEQVSCEPEGSDPACIGFLGHMGYTPNVRAARRLHDQIFLPLKKEIPNLKLTIIGRSPAPEIVELAGPDVVVTGTVDSIWPYISRVTVFVYPMFAGAGLQNKILEAMHAAKPVVTTPISLNSIGARNGDEILCGDTDEELRRQTLKLLRNTQLARNIALHGKRYVDRTFELSSVLDRFERFLFWQPGLSATARLQTIVGRADPSITDLH